MIVVRDRMVEISEGLLEDIRQELKYLDGEIVYPMDDLRVENAKVIDYSDLISKIDEVLK